MALTDKLSAIANAIRAKTGRNTKMTLDEMRNEIANLESGGAVTSYVIVNPVEFTLEASKWNGTTYTLDAVGYSTVYELQIGLPEVSSNTNTTAVVKSALTIPQTSSHTNSTTGVTTVTVTISAIAAPTIDIQVALFGLVAQDTTVTTEVTTE